MKKLSLAIACVAILGSAAFAGNGKGKKDKSSQTNSASAPAAKHKKHHVCLSHHKEGKTNSTPYTAPGKQ
jgi:hypothetical protein